jgi:hypothetical protein
MQKGPKVARVSVWRIGLVWHSGKMMLLEW